MRVAAVQFEAGSSVEGNVERMAARIEAAAASGASSRRSSIGGFG